TFSYVLAVNLPRAGRTFGTAMGGIFDALDRPAMVQAVSNLFKGLEDGITGLVPHLPRVSDGLAAIIDVIGTLASELLPTLGQAFGILGDVATRLRDPLKRIIEQLGPTIRDALTELEPLLMDLADAFADLLDAVADSGLLEAFIELLAELAKVVTPALVWLMQQLADAIRGISDVLGMGDGSSSFVDKLKGIAVGVFAAL